MFQVSQQGAVHVVSGAVPWNTEHLAEARAVCEPLCGKGQPRIVIELSEVAFLDSAGLELLLALRDRSARCGGAVHLAGPNKLCREILQVTGVADEFSIFDDVRSAVGSFAQ